MRLAFLFDGRFKVRLHALKAFDCGFEGPIRGLPKGMLDGNWIVFESDRSASAGKAAEPPGIRAATNLVSVVERVVSDPDVHVKVALVAVVVSEKCAETGHERY